MKLNHVMRMAALGALAVPSFAGAAITITATPATPVYSGPAPTYDFESPAPFTGGSVVTGDIGSQHVTPTGSTGNYGSVGPTDGTPGVLDLSTFGGIESISLLWGTVDSYNTLNLLDSLGNIIGTVTGAEVATAAGIPLSGSTSALVTLALSGIHQDVAALQFVSGSNAFEFDNVAIGAVPEPATWAMMILGFGVVGGAMRRRKQTVRVSFA